MTMLIILEKEQFHSEDLLFRILLFQEPYADHKKSYSDPLPINFYLEFSFNVNLRFGSNTFMILNKTAGFHF